MAAPHSGRTHINYARTLSAKGDFRGAAHAYRATVVARRTPILHLRLADALPHTGQDEAALAQFEIAAQLNPSIAEARGGMGNTALRLSRDWEAERALV